MLHFICVVHQNPVLFIAPYLVLVDSNCSFCQSLVFMGHWGILICRFPICSLSVQSFSKECIMRTDTGNSLKDFRCILVCSYYDLGVGEFLQCGFMLPSRILITTKHEISTNLEKLSLCDWNSFWFPQNPSDDFSKYPKLLQYFHLITSANSNVRFIFALCF